MLIFDCIFCCFGQSLPLKTHFCPAKFKFDFPKNIYKNPAVPFHPPRPLAPACRIGYPLGIPSIKLFFPFVLSFESMREIIN